MNATRPRTPTRTRIDRHPIGRRKLAPMIELMEERTLLSGASGFLTGMVTLDGSGAPAAGATIELFSPGNTTPVATATTASNGQYMLTGLAPGNYQLKEIPPSGTTASSAQVDSQLNPASVASADTINVTVADPNNVFVNYNGLASFEAVNDVVNGKAQPNSIGPFNASIGTSQGATDLNAGFHTFCVNDLQNLPFNGPLSFQATPRTVDQITNGTSTISADHSGRVAYLFNHFGNSSLTNVQGAALQLAIWELIYDSGNTADFTSGNFQVTSALPPTTDAATLSQVVAQATAYFNQSAGHSESAIFLDPTGVSSVAGNFQGVLATCELNFTVKPTNGCDVTNVSYRVNGCKVSSLDNNVHAGDTVSAVFSVPAGMTDTVSLVSYTATSNFDLTKQTVFSYQTQTFGPGTHSLTVKVPNCFFQVDFVCGDVITRFDPTHGITYHGENRFIDSAHGGPGAGGNHGDCGDDGHGKGGSCDNAGHGDGGNCDNGGKHDHDDDYKVVTVCDNNDSGGDNDGHRGGRDDNGHRGGCDTDGHGRGGRDNGGKDRSGGRGGCHA